MTSLCTALNILKPPLVFGNERQIQARRFIEEVEAARESVLVCDQNHIDLMLERFDERELTVRGNIFALQEELHDCSCTRVSSEVLMALAEVLVYEHWRP